MKGNDDDDDDDTCVPPNKPAGRFLYRVIISFNALSDTLHIMSMNGSSGLAREHLRFIVEYGFEDIPGSKRYDELDVFV